MAAMSATTECAIMEWESSSGTLSLIHLTFNQLEVPRLLPCILLHTVLNEAVRFLNMIYTGCVAEISVRTQTPVISTTSALGSFCQPIFDNGHSPAKDLRVNGP